MFKIFKLYFLVGLISQHLHAQDYHYRFENFSLENGLPNSEISGIIQGDQGAIWLSTGIGLVKYDGFSFEIFTHQVEDVNPVIPLCPGELQKSRDGSFVCGKEGYLYKFDPNRAKSLRLPLDEDRISRWYTSLVARDSTIWISNDTGIFLHYSYEHQLLGKYRHKDWTPATKKLYFTGSIHEDQQGDIWVGSFNKGLNLLDKQQNQLISYPLLKGEDGKIEELSDTLNSSAVHDFLELNGEGFWLATNSGLVYFNKHQEKFMHYRFADYDIENLKAPQINCLFYHQGQIWCGTEKKGIMIFDLKQKRFTKNYHHIPYLNYSIASNQVKSFFYSKSFEDGVLWIATSEGLSKLDLYQKPFVLYKFMPSPQGIRKINQVRTIYKDGSVFWVGTKGKGECHLFKIDQTNKECLQYQSDPKIEHSIGDGTVGSIVKRPDGKYWMSTWGGWLNLFDPHSGEFQKWEGYHNDLNFEGWVFPEAVIDRLGNYWLSCINLGLYKMPPDEQKFEKHYQASLSGLPHNVIKKIHVDPKEPPEILWLGTYRGLSRFNTRQETFDNYLQDLKEHPELYCNKILDIYRDESGIFWLAMDGCGLVRFDLERNQVKSFTQKDGLPSNYVYAIYEDKAGFLWISTGNGIAKFDPKHQSFRNYFQVDGLQANQFNYGAHFRDREGRLYFGGALGVSSFYPEKIKDNPFTPRVRLSHLYIHGQRVQVGDTIQGRLVLTKNLNELDYLELHHENNDFTLEFRAIHYAAPSQNRYKYQLVGYDQAWRQAKAPNLKAYYANLPPGEYTFNILASNQDGIWAEDIYSLKILILPPWWSTWWFYSLLSACLLIVGLLYAYLRTYQLKRRNLLLEQKVFEKTKVLSERNTQIAVMVDELREADKAKTNFFTNISHEFRTPLTLILGPINHLIKESKGFDQNSQTRLKIVHRNAQRLLNLINQLLDFAAFDAGKMPLSVGQDDIMRHSQIVASSFNYKARETDITYKVQSHPKYYDCFFDQDKLEKVLFNLLSNAFKFTPKQGVIDLRLEIIYHPEGLKAKGFTVKEDRLSVSFYAEIKDSGPGIPTAEMKKIFSRFYQVKREDNQQAGTGIGLALSQQLIQEHKGQLIVESQMEQGTIFKFFIPVDEKSFAPGEISAQNPRETALARLASTEAFSSQDILSPLPEEGKTSLPSLLIVDDDRDMQFFISDYLKNHFQVNIANNGKEGLEKAKELIPDLIISDIMMPVMNGEEMCQKLKMAWQTSHIPLIFLTAKSGEKPEISGLKEGADDFISKPFSMEVLYLKVRNILNRKKQLQAYLRDSLLDQAQIKLKDISSMDDQFLKKLEQFLAENFADSKLSAETLANGLAVSQTHLYRKLKALTGQTISEYIRAFRLRKAAVLIKKKNANISEIAFKVGFNSSTYFSTSFKKHFGISPQEYAKRG